MSLFDRTPGPSPGLAERRELIAALRQRQPHAPGTWLLLAVNVGIFIAMASAAGRTRFPSRLLILWGALFAPDIADGDWWRLFTAPFLHAHALHLASNMMALALVGPVLERLLGTRTFLSFYIAAALVGSALSLSMHPITSSVGASGAIIGLYGVLLALVFERQPSAPRTTGEQAPFVSRVLLQSQLPLAVPTVAAMLLFGWFGRRIDNAAHIGGVLAGCVFGWIAGRDIEWRKPSGQAAAVAVAAALGCCAVSLATQRDFIDVRPTFTEVFTLDSRAMAQYSALVNSRNDSGSITRTIEQEILPAFARERARLESIGPVPPEQAQILADLRRYLLLRESYWRLRAVAGDRTDAATWQQLDAADRAAGDVMRRLLAAR